MKRATCGTVMWLLAVSFFTSGAALAQMAPDPGAAVMPRSGLRLSDYSSPTPLTLPGAEAIDTAQLRERLAGARPPALIDTAGGTGHDSLPNAVWLPGAGLGTGFDDAVQAQLGQTLGFVTNNDPGWPLVFFCVNRNCWLSYNAALRALRLGYREVYWYRGGLEAWRAAGGAVEPPKVVWKKPAP